jgi:hypothetical protein
VHVLPGSLTSLSPCHHLDGSSKMHACLSQTLDYDPYRAQPKSPSSVYRAAWLHPSWLPQGSLFHQCLLPRKLSTLVHQASP